MTDLEELIAFWATHLALQGYILEATVSKNISATIKALKELKELKGE